MFKKKVFFACLGFYFFGIFAQAIFADNQQINQTSQIHSVAAPLSSYLLSVSIGPTWVHGGKNQTIYSQPEVIRTYSANDYKEAIADGELFFGKARQLHERIQVQFGIALAATTPASFLGNIWDDANSEFNNFAYHYQIEHKHIAVKAKLLADVYQPIEPYLSGSLGVGFNQAGQYTNTPIIPEAIAQPNFTNHFDTTFTYTIGAGLQYSLNKHLQFGLGYEFADWGQSRLSPASGQTTDNSLSLKHIYTNGLLFNFTYVV